MHEGRRPLRKLAATASVVAMVALGAAPPAAAQSSTPPQQCVNGMAGPYPCQNVDLESAIPLPILGGANGNDVWGWTDPVPDPDDGKRHEYALMGTGFSTGFVDVTDPQKPVLVGRLPTRGFPDFILWRDIKVDGNYAFIVSELTGSGLQVFDLTRLRNGSPSTIYNSDAVYDEFSWAHNIGINTETDTAYVVGSDTCENDEEAGGLHMVDISDPLNPTFAGCAVIDDADGSEDTESNNYVHDVECVIYQGPDADYTDREICFGSNENVVAIYDVTDRANPRVVSLREYPTAAYTHQGWLTEDQRYFLFGDELDEQDGTVDNTTTYIMPADDLDAPGEPKAFAHSTRSIDHNLFIRGQQVYESNYTAGLRVLEFDEQSLAAGQLREVGFFDVVPGVDVPEFAGTWSNYPFFESGIVVVSVIENQRDGLFVLRPRLGGGGQPGGGQPGGGQPGGGGQQGAAGQAAGPTRPFRLRAGFGRHSYGRVRRGRYFFVRCRANGSGPRLCRVTASWRGRRIGAGQGIIRRRSVIVRVTLNRRGRRLVRRRPRGVVARLLLRVSDSGGRSAGNSKRVRVRAYAFT
jgi:choice-of-anchor B domain-containing protein